MNRFSFASLLAASAALAASLHATTTSTAGIEGFVQITAPANTDTLISPGFGRPAAWAGLAASASATQITAGGTPAWTTNQFVPGGSVTDTFFVRMVTGALAGQYFTISSNNATTLTVQNVGANLTAIQSGDQLEIAPYWTLGTFYPASQSNISFVPSASSLVRQTELFFYSATGTGINQAPANDFYYYNGAWRQVGSTLTTSFNTTIIPPDTYFLHRNKAAATTVVTAGRVLTGAVATYIEGFAAAQDNYVALAYPAGVTLAQSGLATSGAFATSTSATAPADELLYFSPTQTGINKGASAIYFYYNGGWRQVGAPVTTDFSTTVTLAPVQGFVIRKAPSSTSQVWTFQTGL